VKAKPISREAMAALVNYEWPGNVRELENAIERALVMGSSDMVLLEDLPESLLEQNAPDEVQEGKYHASVKQLKKHLIVDAVAQTGGNYVEAAGILGVHPNYLHRLIRNLGIKEELNQAVRARGKMSGGAA
jgi:Nif-specific regulatory protein